MHGEFSPWVSVLRTDTVARRELDLALVCLMRWFGVVLRTDTVARFTVRRSASEPLSGDGVGPMRFRSYRPFRSICLDCWSPPTHSVQSRFLTRMLPSLTWAVTNWISRRFPLASFVLG